MELSLTDDQQLLRDTAVRYMESACPLETVRRLIDEARSDLPKDYLYDVGQLGWFSLLVPEGLGGGSVSGEGLRDAVIVAEERGRHLQPGAFVASNIVAGALARAGTPEQQSTILSLLVGGATTASWVATDDKGEWSPGTSISYTPTDDSFVLSGTADVVHGVADAQWLLVVASAPEGLSQFIVPANLPGITIQTLNSHDITQRFGRIQLSDVRVSADSLVGAVGGAEAEVEQLFQIALVLSIAETVGALDGLFEMTRQYALDRFAFGRPIGSFQGLKYQLAEMSLSIEAAHAVAVAATRAVQNGQADAGEIVSIAKSWLGDVGIDVAQGCFQIFGGIGYTWEHDLHLFLRRITMNGLLFGQSEWHRERICLLHKL